MHFKINKELAWTKDHYMADCWLVHNGIRNRGCLTLWKNGKIKYPASAQLWPYEKLLTLADEQKRELCLTSENSAWYRTKEEAIAACEKFGHTYEVKET